MIHVEKITPGSELSQELAKSLFVPGIKSEMLNLSTVTLELICGINRRKNERKEIFVTRCLQMEICNAFNAKYKVGDRVLYKINGTRRSTMPMTVRYPASLNDQGVAEAYFWEIKGGFDVGRKHVNYD